MFSLSLLPVACCANVETEEVEPIMVFPKAVPFAQNNDKLKVEPDLTDCSTASGYSSESDTWSNGRTSSKGASDNFSQQQRSKLEAAIDHCRVPNWDEAISAALEKALHSDSGPKTRSGKASTRQRLQKAPEMLMVHSPSCPRCYNGIYDICVNRSVNDQPIWKHANADYWLYSCSKGRWCIGGKDVELDGFQRAAGFLVQTATHDGAMPHDFDSIWQQWDEPSGSFQKDPEIFVQTMY